VCSQMINSESVMPGLVPGIPLKKALPA
jgi:hypothetical protein